MIFMKYNDFRVQILKETEDMQCRNCVKIFCIALFAMQVETVTKMELLLYFYEGIANDKGFNHYCPKFLLTSTSENQPLPRTLK